MKTSIQSFRTLCLVLMGVSLFAASCDTDDKGDTSAPIIHLIEPKEGTILKIGADVHFEMDLMDDVMLASYKVEIHNNFDGHKHTRTTIEGAKTKPFAFQKSWSLTGQKSAHIHQHDIVIPADATPGNYHLMVYCTDFAGNEAHVARNIVLSETGEPHLHMDEEEHEHTEELDIAE